MEEPTHKALLSALEAQGERLDRIEERLRNVESITTFGRGVAWALIRIGATVAAAIAAWEWLRGRAGGAT